MDAKTKAKVDRKRQQDLKRQQAKRTKDAKKNLELGIKEYRVQLSQVEVSTLDELRKFRGGYDVNEYIATLIRRDKERMEREKAELGKCEFCDNELPSGCAKKFKGHGRCFYTINEKALRL
ncbi:hypothetical protein [Marinomonas sp.]|uniref:hypothetical protein n=1 Tax=Marinomonas sp. TaxID=1904862 RepID=UPI003F9C310C